MNASGETDAVATGARDFASHGLARIYRGMAYELGVSNVVKLI